MEEKDNARTFTIGDPYSADLYAKNGAQVKHLPNRKVKDGPYSDLLSEEEFEITLPKEPPEERRAFWDKMNS